MKKLIAIWSCWDEGDYIVSIRPESVKPWGDVPIGPVMSKAQAKGVAEWLNCALPDLQKIIIQTEQDPNV